MHERATKNYQWEIANGAFGEAIGLPMARDTDRVTSLAYDWLGTSEMGALASSSRDNSLIFWNPETSQQLDGVLPQSTNTILSMAISSDGRNLWSGSQDGALLRLEIDPQSWINRLCDLADRSLTKAEWALFFLKDDYRVTCE